MTQQICKACGQSKELEGGFFRNSVKLSGYDAKCKECRGAKAKAYRAAHAEEIAKHRQEYYTDNREVILANKCSYYRDHVGELARRKSEYWQSNKDEIKKRTSEWRGRNKELLALRAKQYRDAILKSAIAVLGGKCAVCGEVEPEFLTVDHINNDGASERRLGAVSWKRLILDGTADPSRYQVLCHNCNLGKYRLDPVHHFKDGAAVGKVRSCPTCGVDKDESEFRVGHTRRCLECARPYQIERRKAMIHALGGACVCCGLDEWHKLVVDHVNNDGFAARALGARSGVDLLAAITCGKLKRADHQLMCWNCNHSKHRGGGLCVHQRNGVSLLGGVTPTIRNTQNTTPIDATDFLLWSVRTGKADLGVAKPFLDAHHYAGFGRASSIVYGAWADELLIGIAKFASPVRQGVAKSIGLSDSQVLELDRFCIHPAYHAKNFASYFMAKAIKLVAANKPGVLKLVSFADPRFGHVGTVYEASNWQKLGETARSYYYEDAQGQEINKKTLYDFAKRRKLTERQCAEALGYEKVRTPPKIKFVYIIKK
jgi:hypothetical protein